MLALDEQIRQLQMRTRWVASLADMRELNRLRSIREQASRKPRHRTMVLIPESDSRDRDYSKHCRFVWRMALACNAAEIPYDLRYLPPSPIGPLPKGEDRQFYWRMEIKVFGVPPDVTPFPKLRMVQKREFTARVQDASYRLDAWFGKLGTEAKWNPGNVIEHESGLRLTHKSGEGFTDLATGELVDNVKANWSLTHSASGMSIVSEVPFSRALAALNWAIGKLDWTLPSDQIGRDANAKRILLQLQAEFGGKKQSHGRTDATGDDGSLA